MYTGTIATQKTLEFHKKILVIDALALDYVLDEPYRQRMQEGGIDAAFVCFVLEENWDKTMRIMEINLQKIEQNPLFKLVKSAKQLLEAKRQGKIAVVIGFQSASMIEADFWRLDLLYRMGLRCIQLTYTAANLYGDGCGERRNGGLTFLGQDFIEKINELGIMLDLSHCGHETTQEAIKIARLPVCTHANSYTVNNNDRNKMDDAVKALVAKGGMIGICGLPRSVKSENPTLDDMLNHLDYFVKIVGYENIGLGLDFTEGMQEQKVVLPQSRRWRRLRPDIFGSVDDFVKQKYPEGLESIRLLPNFTQKLFDRGYSESQVEAILGGNWLRVFRKTSF